MNPKYSILLCNQLYSEYSTKIKNWLESGIKVLWFSTDAEEVKSLQEEFPAFAKALLLQAYHVEFDEKICILDGRDEGHFVENVLASKCPLFNSAQYQVEHCNSNEHIIVQASAGTGKTTVMIDRILYLLHTQPDLHLSEVFMITFTNDATDQMNKKLQDTLLLRYKLTGQEKYLRWVEEQSQMNISTIHSFAYYMLKQYGIGEGFTKDLSIRSFQYEKKELIKDVIDERIDDSHPVFEQLGVPFYRANSLVKDYWEAFSKLGVSHKNLTEMNWGKPANSESVPFQNVMSGILTELDEKYFEIKRKNEAISIDDIMRDLQQVLANGDLPTPDITMKYLFIDEFQDSDLSQIKVACMMINLLGPAIFVVGDVKQSIYRFRGANDQAFALLKDDMKEMHIKPPKEFTLVNNYRTSATVLTKMDHYFQVWGSMGQLQYDRPVIPFNQTPGTMKMLHAPKSEDELDGEIASLTSQCLNNLVNRVQEDGIIPNEKTRVVLLTRANKDLNKLSAIMRKNKIPASIRRDGSFFTSEAVRDFYIMAASYMYPDEPKYIFNFLLTPYAGDIDPMNINDMEWLNGDYENLVDYLNRFLEQTSWKKYHKELRLRPVLSVFKEMMDEIPVVDNYIQNTKSVMRTHGWEEARCNAQTFTNARQYQANLEKLLEVLQRNLGGDKVSIYDVYNFLRLNIQTNRSEGEAEVQAADDYTSVLCMSVHKAKGLEFDTVVIPFTNKTFPIFARTEILIDPTNKRVGWNYSGDKEKKNKRRNYTPMKNDLYDDLREEEADAVYKEEVRILYVAMTRAINNLFCLVPDAKNERTWAHLIEEVGVDYE